MESLKDMIDKKMSISDINQITHQYIDSVNSNPDKLRVTFVLLYILKEASNVLSSVDFHDFSKQMIERINFIEKEVKNTSDAFNGHLHENDLIVDVLINNGNTQVSMIQQQIKELLSSYDDMIKQLVAERERLALFELPKKV